LFNLAEYVQVNGASFEGGLLKIDLMREDPEAKKPRQIGIQVGNDDTFRASELDDDHPDH
jgi:molecular chaperone IbpA